MAVSSLQTTHFQLPSSSNKSAALMDNGAMDLDMDLDLGPIDIPEASYVSVRSQPPDRRTCL